LIVHASGDILPIQLNGRSVTWVTPTFLFVGPPEDVQQRGGSVSRDFVGALLQLNAEKQVSREQLIHAVEDGIQSAYRRVAGDEDIHVRIDAETGKIRVFRAKTAVDEVEDPLIEFSLEEARAHKADAKAGDLVETEELPDDVFGRIGAQTAKQIVLQRIREVERDQVFDKFANREGEMITGTVNRVEPRAIILDVGNNVEAILSTSEQSSVEHYRIGQNVKAYVLEVRRSSRGPQILVSRTHKGFLKRLFELEVPEVHSGTVEIRAIAREPGSRSKVAVSSRQEGLDPVGATVGQRGARVQAVVAELGGEKIDIIPWNDDASVFVANALSPAQVISVDIDEEKRIANVTVPERMLSLAIGREGQNARLAARLTGWRIDIRSDVSVAAKAAEDEAAAGGPVAPVVAETVPAAAAEAPAPAAAALAPAAGTPVAETAAASIAEVAEVAAPAKKTRAKKAAAEPATALAAKPAPEPEAAAAAPAKKKAAPAAEPGPESEAAAVAPAKKKAAAAAKPAPEPEAAAAAPAKKKAARTKKAATEEVGS
jgi:N utilization substance protein A